MGACLATSASSSGLTAGTLPLRGRLRPAETSVREGLLLMESGGRCWRAVDNQWMFYMMCCLVYGEQSPK